jgi:hypothetical protein
MTSTISTRTSAGAARIDALRTELEDLWGNLDRIFDSLSDTDWRRRHGKDWTIADVPYHLAYFDRQIVLLPLQRRSAPLECVRIQRTMRELNEWNAREFAQRPPNQTALESLAQWRAIRAEVRDTLAALTDADLDSTVRTFLAGMGARPLSAMLGAYVAHSWSHLGQLRYYLKRRDAVPSAAAVRRAMAFYAHMMAFGFVPERGEAYGRPFTAGLEITGPSGGTWAMRVSGRRLQIDSADVTTLAGDADMRLTMSPDTFIKMFAEIASPMWLMLTGQIRVHGLSKMPTFGKLFPPFQLDREVTADQIRF